MGLLKDFYYKETKPFSVTIVNKDTGISPDISADAVSVIFKSSIDLPDTQAAIAANADVTTNGATGKAAFVLTVSQTAVTPGTYYYDIKWTLQSGEVYILDSSTVKILPRVYQ